MTPRIELQNVSKTYVSVGGAVRSLIKNALGIREGAAAHPNGHRALDAITLTLHAGERLGVIGQNGSGKSTLCQVIAGLMPASEGIIKVEGRTTAIFALGLGLREDLTGRQNIGEDARLQGRSRQDLKVALSEIIGFADLGEYIDRPVRTYSSGMKSRLAFSLIIHVDPEILIVDEALSAGDYFFGVKAAKKMREICERGKISIIVSHNMKSIVDLCTRCLWIEAGKVVMDGTPVAVTQAYRDSESRRGTFHLSKQWQVDSESRPIREGAGISRLQMWAPGEASESSMAVVGESAALRVGLRTGGEGKDLRVRLQIYKMGGCVVVDETRAVESLVQNVDDRMEWDFSLTMQPVILGPGSYQAVVELMKDDTVMAMRAQPFRVVAKSIQTGGEPILLCPSTVSVSRIG